jgi:zinc protease
MQIKRENPPIINGAIKFVLPKFNEFILNNGLSVLFVEKKNLPILQLNMLVNGGSKFDPIKKKGLAHLTSLLVDEGAGEYDSLQYDEEFESIGSIFNLSTDNDNIHLTLLSLKENFERSLELMSLAYNVPRFIEEDFKREQNKLLAKITQNQDDPGFIATSNFDKIIFNNTNYQYPIIGNTNDVSSIKNSDVIEFHKKFFVPSNSKLVVVGNIELAELQSLLNKYFNVGKHEKTFSKNQPSATTQKSNFYFIHKDGAAQSEIRIGHISEKRNEGDYFAKVIANSILGGQFSSRLNLNLRENKGFTYGIQSAFMYYTDAGYFEISTSVNGKDTGAAIKEIQKEITGIKAEITDSEIEFTKSYLVKRFPAMFETYSQIAHHLSTMLKHNLSKNYFDSYIEKISTCEKSEIESVAKKKIKLDELIFLVVGDRKIVLPQLKDATELDIIELDVDGNII